MIEAVITNLPAAADIRDPDLPDQPLSTRRALAEMNRIRIHHLESGNKQIRVITRRNPLHASICAALAINTSAWDTPSSPTRHPQRPKRDHVGETPLQRVPNYQDKHELPVKVR